MFIAFLGALGVDCQRNDLLHLVEDHTGDRSIECVWIDAERQDRFTPWQIKDHKRLRRLKDDIATGESGIVICLSQFPGHLVPQIEKFCRRRNVSFHNAPPTVNSLSTLRSWLSSRTDILPRSVSNELRPVPWTVSKEEAILIGILGCLLKVKQFTGPEGQGHGGHKKDHFPRSRPLRLVLGECREVSWKRVFDRLVSAKLLVRHGPDRDERFNLNTDYTRLVMQCFDEQTLSPLRQEKALDILFNALGEGMERCFDIAPYIDNDIREMCRPQHRRA